MIKTGVPIALDEKGNIITWDYIEPSSQWYLPKSAEKVEYFDRNPVAFNPRDWQVCGVRTMA